MIRKILLCIFMIGLAMFQYGQEARAASGWVIFWDGSYHGKVIDIETKEPIEGAVVFAVYHVSCFRIVQSNTKEVGVKEVLTQADGTFRIPPFWTITTPECLASFTDINVIKTWYGSFPTSPSLLPQGPRSRIYSPENPGLTHEQDIFRVGAVVELPRLKDKEELRRNVPSSPVTSDRLKRYLKNYYKLINERRKILGFTPLEIPGE